MGNSIVANSTDSKMDKSDMHDVDNTKDAHSNVGDVTETGVTHDAVFGDITTDGPNYRNIGLLGTAALMIKSQIGLGVLSIPFTLDALGMVPGVLIIIAVCLMTWWSNYVIGTFKARHPEVYSIDDAAELMFGRIGKEIFAALFCLFFTFCCASALLSLSIALNALSLHGACTAVFCVVAAIIAFTFGSVQTLSRMSWLAWLGTVSIITAILTVSIAVSLQDRPAAAPKTGDFHSDYKIIASPSFTTAAAAISSIIFSYAGVPAYFNIASEMKNTINISLNTVAAGMDLTSVLPEYLDARRGSLLLASIGFGVCPWNFVKSAETFTTVLSAIGLFLSPLTGMYIADFWVIRRKNWKVRDLYTGNKSSIYWYTGGFNMRAVATWFLLIWMSVPGLASALRGENYGIGWSRIFDMTFFVGFIGGFVVYSIIATVFPMEGARTYEFSMDDFDGIEQVSSNEVLEGKPVEDTKEVISPSHIHEKV